MIRTANFILQLVVAFFMMPIIVHSLGDRMYGFWALIGTFLGYYGIFDLGLSSAVQRYVSRALGQNDVKDINDVVNTSFFLFMIAGGIVLIISFFAAIFCFYFIRNPEEVSLFRKVIVILGISMAVGFPMRVFDGILSSHLRYDLVAYASMIRLTVASVFIYYFLKNGYGILAIALVSFFANLLEHALTFSFSKRTFTQLQIRFAFYEKDTAKLLFGYSGKTFIAQLADILRFRVDAFVIAGFLNLSMVAYYSIGARLVELFGQLVMSIMGIMSPVFSQYEGRGDYDAIRKMFTDATKISVIISVFVGMSIIYYGKVFIQRWMGLDFGSSYYVAVILCVPYIIALMQNPSTGLLYGISKHHYYAVTNGCEGMLNLLLSLILVKYYGIYGVALGTAIAMIIFKLFVQPIVVCRAINLSIYDFYLKTLFYTAIKTLAPLLLYFYIIKDFLRADYTSIILTGIIQALLFIPIAFFFILGKKERQLIKSTVGLA